MAPAPGDRLQELRERRRSVLVAAEADDDDVLVPVPGRYGRRDHHAAGPGEIGIREGQPAKVEPARPAVVLKVAGDDEMPGADIGFLDFALGPEFDGPAAG